MRVNDTSHQSNNGGHHPHSSSASSSSAPIALPGAPYSNNTNNNDDNDYSNENNNEGTPLLPSTPRSIPKLFLESCRVTIPSSSNNSPWETLGNSPMISHRPNSLRLPNLDLREARRSAAAIANARMALSSSAEFGKKNKGGRPRSSSFGNHRGSKRSLLGAGDDSEDDDDRSTSPLLLGEEILKRRTPSGLSLMDLDSGDFPTIFQKNGDVESNDYGAIRTTTTTTTTKVTPTYMLPLKKEGEESIKPITTSQSCSIAKLNPTDSPPPPTPPSTGKKPKKVSSSDKTLVQELKEEFASQSNPPILSLLYGIVNLFIVLPVITSFGSIIYHDEFFRPYMSALMKLTVVSGVVHQLTFATFSSLPFAVGQVQDAGLIFLSAMATDIVSKLKSREDVDDESILATVTVGLSVYTAVLGCALVLIGKFQLASYCQLLPSAVVGGYLAFIGFFCGQAGLALMASVDVTGVRQWYKFLDAEALMLLIPGVVGGCTIYFSVRASRHMAVLPTCIIMIMVAFYGILWGTGTSVEEATELGWINKTVEAPSWSHTWDFLKIDKVVWSVLPSQTVTLLAMISVVALSSSLDIAAIEIELKRPLDYNHELQTVGLSNIISGITGGYTGSYIFSQTIFSLRMGIRSRLMGYTIAFLSLIFVVIPINVLSYVPNFFFGSLLVMICVDLMFEWLIDVRHQVATAEYVVVLSTFAFCLTFGVEFGIIAGIALHVALDKFGLDVGKGESLNEDGMAMTNC